MSISNSHYSFNSVQTHTSLINGKRNSTTEAVSIRNGKGMKTVVKRVGSKQTKSKKPLSSGEIQNVMKRKFMPGFFVPCHNDCDMILNSPNKPSAKKPSANKPRQTRKRVKKGSK